MSVLQEPIPDLGSDERAELWDKFRDSVAGEAAGAGFVLPGTDSYEKDWDMNWDWGPCKDDMRAEVMSATLVTGKRNKRTGRVRASTLKKVQLNSGEVKAMREATGFDQMKEWSGNPDPFGYGQSQSLQGGSANTQYLPLWPGPVTRQLYWQDYWMMSAKAFEAYNHDPVSWRCIHLKAEFALGRGLERKVSYGSGSKRGQTHDKGQKVYDEFWKRNKMDRRLDTIARDYCWAGEQFLRYFKTGQKLTVRSLDPATIYDLITDPEDIETVFAYHQQFQTAYQLYPPDKGTPPTGVTAPTGASTPGAVTRYIIRQILPQEIDHYKTNSSGYERRGRSDLYPALGWIKRLRDYLTAHVVHADMVSRICWDLKVAGNQSAITKIQQLLFPNGQAPQPGTIFGHNTATELTPIVPSTTGGATPRGDPILDALVTMTSLSGGVPKDWLGFGIQNTRAGALVATEPAAKSLQELQGTLEEMLHDQFDRVMKAANVFDAEVEISFPSITAEDREQKLDDLGTMESNDWLSKQTAATLAGKEMDITTYDYDAEQSLIAAEFDKAEDKGSEDTGLLGPDGKSIKKAAQGGGVMRRPMLIATKRQAPKLDPTKASQVEDEPPGLAVPLVGETLPAAPGDGTAPPGGNKNGSASVPAPGSKDGTGRTVAGGGNHTNSDNPMTASGQKDIRSESRSLRSKESEEDTITLSREDLNWLLMRERRRRPDDQVFRQESEEYRSKSKEHLKELAGSLDEEGGPGRDSE